MTEETSRIDALVKRLRSIDHLSVEDCFCQSGLYDQAADAIEALTAERDRLASLNVELCDNYNTLLVVRSRLQDRADKAEADNARLRKAAIALRDDMLERSQLRIDAINGEQYRIVNAGAGVWMDFCAALNTEKEPSHE